MIPVECLIGLSALLFFIGVFGFVTRRNLLAMLISVELVLNSADINFAVFNRILFPEQLEGFFLHVVLHWHQCCRDSGGDCHYYKRLPKLW